MIDELPHRAERLGHLLVSAGLIDEPTLEEALEAQRHSGRKLGEVLVSGLSVTEEDIARTLAQQKGLGYISLTTCHIDRDAASRLPERLARMHSVILVAFFEDAIVVAMADPLDIEALDDVRMTVGMRVIPLVTTDSQVRYAIEKYIASADAFEDMLQSVEATETLDDMEIADDSPVVRLVNQVIREAVIDEASDIHIEPGERSVRVRFRIDGVLQQVMELPNSARAGMISRLKIMSEMNIAERRRPQDGRASVMVEGKAVDLRIASLPTPNGESMVIRLLDRGLRFRSMEDLGMSEPDHVRFKGMVSRPWGAVLVAGPTGSGKTTSLYAVIQRINVPERKIITIEDPVEYQLGGVTQLAVNPKVGFTFANGLRTVVRADPDVVMIGEIRDPETAEIAIRAALTGHLVLSSIHTNDAPSALTRLVDMKVAPYITTSALVGVVSQRLARRLCPSCRREAPTPPEVLLAAGFSEGEVETVVPFVSVGCDKCHNTGYLGRVGLFELLEVDDDIKRLFLKEASSEELRYMALEHGMVPLRRDALDKVAAGVTSLEEIARVVL